MKMKNTPKEWDYIQSIRDIVRREHAETLLPLGDDAFAVRAPKDALVMAQDMMIEDVHFDLRFSSAADLGHKSLAVNLSDLAATGATPRWAMVSLGLPEKMNKSWLDEFYQSMSRLADRWGVEIVGGDLCASPHALVIDVSLSGEARTPLSRRGARPGDLLLCSGPLGLAANGLAALREGRPAPASIERQLRPDPRLDLLPELCARASEVHALIDVSDGLVSECLHLSRNLELGLELNLASVPSHPEVEKAELILWGGEDYQLLMAVAPSARHLFSDWTQIGEFNTRGRLEVLHPGGGREEIREFRGWKHFVSK